MGVALELVCTCVCLCRQRFVTGAELVAGGSSAAEKCH